jgi:hypothetical protein
VKRTPFPLGGNRKGVSINGHNNREFKIIIKTDKNERQIIKKRIP